MLLPNLMLFAMRPSRYAEECQTPLGGWGLDAVLRSQAWKLRGAPPARLQPEEIRCFLQCK